jgi:4-hydroxy-tetrahydrodipicolinate synthase
MAIFNGVGAALITLFHGNGDLDASGTADLAARLVEAGVQSVVLGTETGEGVALLAEERLELLDAVRGAVSAVPVIATVDAAWGREAARMTRAAREHGADAVLVPPPPFTDDAQPFYAEVASAAGGVPVLASGAELAQLGRLRVVGSVDPSGDATRLLETQEVLPGDLYTGSAALLALAGAVGATGAVVALANAEPERCAAAFAGDGDAQRALALPHVAVQIDFPEAIKVLVAKRFGTSTVSRLG